MANTEINGKRGNDQRMEVGWKPRDKQGEEPDQDIEGQPDNTQEDTDGMQGGQQAGNSPSLTNGNIASCEDTEDNVSDTASDKDNGSEPKPGVQNVSSEDGSGDGEDEEIKFFEKIELPTGTVIEYKDNNGIITNYIVSQHLGSGNFGNTYLVQTSGQTLVLKEFCTKDAKRQMNGIDKYKILFETEPTLAIQKFRKEPDKVLQILHNADEETPVTPGLTLNEARQEARMKVGKGKSGYFRWGNEYYSTYTDKEAQAMNVALPCTPVFNWKGNLYYVMEKANGQTLKDYKKGLMESNAKIDLDFCLKIMEQFAIAVENIHRSCIHMDLSPTNVIFEQDEEGKVKLKVIDFGMAAGIKAIEESIRKDEETHGSILNGGTPGFTDFSNNERIYKRNPDCYKLIDIYSLGAILYYLLFYNEASINEHTINKDIVDMHRNVDYFPYKFRPDDRSDDANTSRILNACYGLVRKATTVNKAGYNFDGRISAAEFKSEINKMQNNVSFPKEMYDRQQKRYQLTPQADERTLSLSMSPNGNWMARIECPDGKDEDWIAFDNNDVKKIGSKEARHLTLNLKPNRTGKERMARVIIKANIIEKEVYVVQPPMPEEETVCSWVGKDNPEMVFGSLAGEQTIIFKANKKFECNMIPAANGWMDIATDDIDSNVHRLVIKVKANEDAQKREAKVVITSAGRQIVLAVSQKVKEKQKPFIKFPDGVIAKKSFDYKEGIGTIPVFANNEWNAQVSSEGYGWLELSQSNGQEGKYQVQYKVKENDRKEERKAEIVFTCDECRISWIVVQSKCPEAKIEFEQGTINQHLFDGNGGQTWFNFIANFESSVTFIPEEAAKWLNVNYKVFEPGHRTLTIQAKGNDVNEKRDADIQVLCRDKYITFKVAQDGRMTPPPPTKYEIQPLGDKDFSLPAGFKGTQDIRFKCNDRWTASILEDRGWLKINRTEGQAGENTIIVTVDDENKDINPREAKILVICGGTVNLVYTIKQDKVVVKDESATTDEVSSGAKDKDTEEKTLTYLDKIIPRSALSLVFSDDAGSSQGIAFTCNKNWTAKVLDNQYWLQIDMDKGVAGDIQLRVKPDTNTSYESRKGVVRITTGNAVCDFTVTQYGKPIPPPPPAEHIKALGSTNLSYADKSDNTKHISFECTGNWNIRTVDGQGWMDVEKSSGRSGKHSVKVTVKDNKGTASRTAKVIASCGTESVTYSIRQSGKKNPNVMVWIISVIGFILAGGATWYLLNIIDPPVDTLAIRNGQPITLPHEGGNELVELDASNVWQAEVVESEPEEWLRVNDAAGDENDHDFLLSADMNKTYNRKVAKVKVSCGDMSRLLQVTQGIDRADSLQTTMLKVMSDMSLAGSFMKNTSRFFSLYEYDKKTGNKEPLQDVFLLEVLDKSRPGIILGRTHDVKEFEQDEKGKLKSITLQKR